MKRAIVGAVTGVLLLGGCGGPTGGATDDLATVDVRREGLRDADLIDTDLTHTDWDDFSWEPVDVEALVAALGLTLEDLGARPGLDAMIASYSDHLGLDPERGTGEEDIVALIVSTRLERLAQQLDVDAFDALHDDRDTWPDLVPDASDVFRARMEHLGLVSLHLRQAMMIEVSRAGDD